MPLYMKAHSQLEDFTAVGKYFILSNILLCNLRIKTCVV